MKLAALVALILPLTATSAFAEDVKISGKDGKNAFGSLQCSAVAGFPLQECPFEVFHKEGGSVTVRVLLPLDQVRYIYFENGEPTSTDSTSQMQSKLRGETFVVTIDPSEVIEIPKSMITGG